jgi:hypothetical protein
VYWLQLDRKRRTQNSLTHLLHWLAAAGSQLFNSYGPRSNDDLLLRYSFVAAHNPDDVYVLDDLPQRLRLQQVAKTPAGPASWRGRMCSGVVVTKLRLQS